MRAALAEFILGNSLSGAARKYPFLQRVLWRIDFALIWSLIKVFSLLPPDTASRLGSRLGRVVGPRLRRKTEMFRENLSIAFPEKSDAELQQLILQSWRSAGRVLAEYPHFNTIYESRDRQRLHTKLLDPTLRFGEARIDRYWRPGNENCAFSRTPPDGQRCVIVLRRV